MKDIAPILKALGLLDSETKLYLRALEDGPGTVLDLAKATGLSRQAIYVAIESLTKRGLMSSALRGKKRFYAAEHPDKLLDYAKRRDAEMHERVQDLERLLPELEMQAGGERPVVKLFEGREGLKAIITDLTAASHSRDSVEITDVEAMFKVLSREDLAAMRKSIAKSGTKVRGFYTSWPKDVPRVPGRFVLPKKYAGLKTNIGIYGDKIALVTFAGKMFSVVIESKELTETLRALFELAFKGADRSDAAK